MNHIDAGRELAPDLLESSDFRRAASEEAFRTALEARTVVDTAIGVTMGKRECSRESALEALLSTARSFDITVLELARGIVAGME